MALLVIALVRKDAVFCTGSWITNPKSGKCLDADTDTYPKDGTKIQLWNCGGEDDEMWEIQAGRILNRRSGKCLDADTDTYPKDGTKIQLWKCGDGDGQKWGIQAGKVVNSKSGKCLDADTDTYPKDGTKIQLWKCGGGDGQKWQVPAPSPPTPLPTWPTFTSSAQLKQSTWSTYFLSLYGELPEIPAGTTLDLKDFWCFYLDKANAAQVNIYTSVGQCPKTKRKGERYDENNAYSSKDLTWLWHPLSSAPFNGFSSNTIVEVSHKKDPFGDEHHGMWFVYAKGSGVFLDIGKTKIFNDHGDAEKYFHAKGNEDMCQQAAANSFDSIQFIKHTDGTNYPCAAEIGVPWMNMEIVAVKLVGTYPCGQKTGTAAPLRAGWKGSRPCKCDPNNPNTNCVFSFDVDRIEEFTV